MNIAMNTEDMNETLRIEVPSCEKEAAPGDRSKQAVTSYLSTLSDIWRDHGVNELISKLIRGEITAIEPNVELGDEAGYSYPAVDDILGTGGEATAKILRDLCREGILVEEYVDSILISPEGSIHLVPVERCPDCGSSSLTRGRIIEHFVCGHTGAEEDFKSGSKLVCPKCKKELKLIGTDYRNPGLRYTCHCCNGVFATPAIMYRCLRTEAAYKLDELRSIKLYSYHLNDSRRSWLEFELQPKRLFIEYLLRLGYEVEEYARLQGQSGTLHTIDLLASMNDPITRHTIAVGVLAAPPDDEVSIDSLFRFDSQSYDIGIRHRIVLAIPRLSSEAEKFAERQNIRVFGMSKLRYILYQQVFSLTHDRLKKVHSEKERPVTFGPGEWLRRFLENRGYRVAEEAVITGRSGTDHILDFYAEKVDNIVSHKLAAMLLVDKNNPVEDFQKIIQFDTAAYDAGVSDKVVIADPELCRAVRQFAAYQHIRLIELEDFERYCEK